MDCCIVADLSECNKVSRHFIQVSRHFIHNNESIMKVKAVLEKVFTFLTEPNNKTSIEVKWELKTTVNISLTEKEKSQASAKKAYREAIDLSSNGVVTHHIEGPISFCHQLGLVQRKAWIEGSLLGDRPANLKKSAFRNLCAKLAP